MIAIVDTNVPVVANGRSAQASIACMVACAQQLQQITRQGKLVLDNQWRILREYMAHLHTSVQPGVGDAFLKWALNNIANPDRIETVSITPCNPVDPDETDFQRVSFRSRPGQFRSLGSQIRCCVPGAFATPACFERYRSRLVGLQRCTLCSWSASSILVRRREAS